jgi:hypothetical protein
MILVLYSSLMCVIVLCVIELHPTCHGYWVQHIPGYNVSNHGKERARFLSDVTHDYRDYAHEKQSRDVL